MSIARQGIGVIKYLAPYLALKSRDEIYKIRVRVHLDYCDVIYHTPVITREGRDFDSSRNLSSQMAALERTQYQAALAVSGAWKGTNRTKICNELGWESLDHRRMLRRLALFYTITTGLTPEYLRDPIPELRGHLDRNTNVLNTIPCINSGYHNSFYPDSVFM